MSFQDISPKKLVIILIVAGVLIVFALSGFQARNLFAESVTEEVEVLIRNDQGTCIVEGSDDIPRNIENCPYNEGDMVSITYKPKSPTIERHAPGN